MIYEHLLLNEVPLLERMSMEELFESACHRQEIPGAVLIANGPGGFHYSKAFGVHSLDTHSPPKSLKQDAVFWTASCTKLHTSVAALQCVERGLIDLDEDITRLLPEFKDVHILTGLDTYKKPILVPFKNTLTLRHLLTHTSGMSYNEHSALLQKHLAIQSRPSNDVRHGKIVENYLNPIIFEPGSSWQYGTGLDWAGQVVERISSLSLEQYMQQNIWHPLGMRDTTFRLNERADLIERVMDMHSRVGLIHPMFRTTLSPEGRLKAIPEANRGVLPGDDYGGAGIYSTMTDFAKLLHSLCINNGILLRRETVDMMFMPQLGVDSKARMAKMASIPEVNNAFGGIPNAVTSVPLDWGLGGMLVLADVVGTGGKKRRKSGSMFWSGMPNLYWWIDRKSEVSGICATQVLPTGDPKCLELLGKFEEAIYERVVVVQKRRGPENL